MAVNRLNLEPTFAELISDVAADVNELAAAHLQQLRDELAQQAAKARSAAIALIVGGIIGIIGVTFAFVAGIHALIDFAGWTPTWAWLLGAAAMIAVASMSLTIAFQQWRSFHAVPEETIASVKETISCVSQT